MGFSHNSNITLFNFVGRMALVTAAIGMGSSVLAVKNPNTDDE